MNSSVKVIGINDSIIRGVQNLGVAIPIDLAHAIIPDLIELRHAYHPTLGFTGTEITLEVARLLGIPIERNLWSKKSFQILQLPSLYYRLESGSLCLGRNVIRFRGDVIVAINDEAVTSPANIAKSLPHGRPEQVLKLRLYRQGQTLEGNVPLLAMYVKF